MKEAYFNIIIKVIKTLIMKRSKNWGYIPIRKEHRKLLSDF